MGRHYTQLNIEDRCELARLHAAGRSLRQIATALDRAPSTIAAWLWGEETVAAASAANDVWCMDFKGWFRTADGTRINPLTVQDAASRYLLACRGLPRPNGPEVRRVVGRAFREYGLPRAIRTDNGPPFASLALGWIKLGITPERIASGHPTQNGRLERLHRTLKAETTVPPKSSRVSQQRAWRRGRLDMVGYWRCPQ